MRNSVEVPVARFMDLLPAVEAKLGGAAGTWLLDTGAGVTCLDAATAAREGVDGWGRLAGHRMMGEIVAFPRADDVTIDLGGVPCAHETVGIVDLGAFLPPKAGEILGVLSLTTFAGTPFTLDLPGERLILESPETLEERTRGLTSLPVRCARGIAGLATDLFVAVESERGRLWFELDSGNAGPVIVSPTTAKLLGVPSLEPEETGDMELPLSGLSPIPTPVRIRDTIYDGVIGLSVLNEQAITIDTSTSQAWT